MVVGIQIAVVGYMVAHVGGTVSIVGEPVAFVGEVVTFVGGPFSFVSELFAFVSDPFSFMSELFAFVRDSFSFVRVSFAFIKIAVALVCVVFAFVDATIPLVGVVGSQFHELPAGLGREPAKLRAFTSFVGGKFSFASSADSFISGLSTTPRVLIHPWGTELALLGRGSAQLRSERAPLVSSHPQLIGELLSLESFARIVVSVVARDGHAIDSRLSSVGSIERLAARHETLTHNPARDIARIQSASTSARSLTLVEAQDLRAKLAANPGAVEWDLPDLTDMMLATAFGLAKRRCLSGMRSTSMRERSKFAPRSCVYGVGVWSSGPGRRANTAGGPWCFHPGRAGYPWGEGVDDPGRLHGASGGQHGRGGGAGEDVLGPGGGGKSVG